MIVKNKNQISYVTILLLLLGCVCFPYPPGRNSAYPAVRPRAAHTPLCEQLASRPNVKQQAGRATHINNGAQDMFYTQPHLDTILV